MFSIKLLVRLFALLPFRFLYMLSDLFFYFLFYGIKYRRKVVHQNLSNAFPEKTPAEINSIARQYYRHLCDLLVETVKGLSLPKAELQRRFHYRNPEIFAPILQKKQSALLFGSHYGNWEWGTLSIPLVLEHTVVGIYKPLKDKALNQYLYGLRQQWGLHLAPMANAGRAVVEYRKQTSVFVFIADQTPVDVVNAHWLRFLNQDTPFLHGTEKLARSTGYPVFYVEIEKVKRGFYEVTFKEICAAGAQFAEGEMTALYAARLEAAIQREPAFWLWSHRRWKRKRPEIQ